jgi:hypothetical protein
LAIQAHSPTQDDREAPLTAAGRTQRQKIIAQGVDWRFLTELKKKLEA